MTRADESAVLGEGARAPEIGLTAATALLVAVSRVYLGAHSGTDVAGGVIVGLFWVSLHAPVTELCGTRPDLT